jgi:hypothetical protein
VQPQLGSEAAFARQRESQGPAAAVANPDSEAAHLLDLIRQRADKYREILIARSALNILDKDSPEFGRALEYIGTLAGNIETINLVIDAAVAVMEGETE